VLRRLHPAPSDKATEPIQSVRAAGTSKDAELEKLKRRLQSAVICIDCVVS
jgi:hypothetical protein